MREAEPTGGAGAFRTIVVAVVLGPLSGSFASAQPPTFQHVVIDAANPADPHCKTLADVDGDGLLDALAASSSGGGLHWYEYPAWTKHAIRASGSWTTDMQAGDIDGDGDPDVVIPRSSGLYWYENPRPAGDPRTDTWSEHLIGASGANNHDVELGDIDGDLDLDVVTRRKTGNSTYFWRQTTPTSWTRITVSGSAGEGTALGDIDGDGDLDVAHNGFWVEQVDPLTWTEHPIVAGWPGDSGVLIVDVNGDGGNDVVLAPSEGSGRFSWFEAADPVAGPWTEHPIDATATYFHTFKAADMDRDGDLDLVTAEMHQSSDPDEVSLYLNEGGAGTLWTQQVVASSGSHNLRLGDIGADGDIDIYGANWNDSAPNSAVIEMWENLAAPLPLDLWQRHMVETSLPWNAVFVDAGDVDGDGRRDIVTGGWWYPNPGALDGVWTRTVIGAPLNNLAALHDFDADGDPDVLGTDGKPTGAGFSWARNEGGGVFTPFDITHDPTGGDFLQGVSVDQIVAGGPPEVVLSWHNGASGTSMFEVPADPTTAVWPLTALSATTNMEQVPTGDVDGDGDEDVHLGTSWLRQESDGSFSTRPGVTLSGGDPPDRVALADLDGDGDLDVVIGVEFGQALVWGENAGAGTGWAEHPIGAAVEYFSVDVGDLDKDGDPDVVGGAHMGLGEVFVYENDGAATWTPHVVDPGDSSQIDHHDGTRLVDLDDDGDLDIVSIGWSKRSLVIYENLALDGGGGGDTVPPEIVAVVGEPLRVTVEFSEPLDAASAESAGGYALSDGAVVLAATLSANPRVVSLSTTALTAGVVYTLTVDGVEDLAGNEVPPATQAAFALAAAGSPPGLVAHWPLDEGGGALAADASGHGHLGVLVNGPSWTAGPALEFDGADDYVDVGALDVSGSALTIAVWVWADDFANCSSRDCRILSKATSTAEADHYFMLSTIAGGATARLRFRLKTAGVTTTLIAGSGDLAESAWFHAAAVYDGAEMRLYLDGALVGSTAKSGAISQNGAVAAWIGGNPSGASSKPWAGRLDDVRVYDRALTAAELAALPPPSAQMIFADGFESGLAAWRRSPGGALAAAAGAAFSGAAGLEATAGSSCVSVMDLEVAPPPATVLGEFEACRRLAAQGVTVVAPGAVFRAGERVALEDGLEVAAAAALELVVEPALSPFSWVEDGSPEGESSYTASFFVRLDDLSLAAGDRLAHFVGFGADGTELFRLVLERSGAPAGNRLTLEARHEDGTYSTTAGQQLALPDGWRGLRVQWRAGVGDGALELWLDGVFSASLEGLDNGALRLDAVRWGAVGGSLAGPAGRIAGDAFLSWR